MVLGNSIPAIRRSKWPTCFSTAGTVPWSNSSPLPMEGRLQLKVQQFISAIKARPVQAVRVHDPAEARRRLGLLGNVRS